MANHIIRPSVDIAFHCYPQAHFLFQQSAIQPTITYLQLIFLLQLLKDEPPEQAVPDHDCHEAGVLHRERQHLPEADAELKAAVPPTVEGAAIESVYF